MKIFVNNVDGYTATMVCADLRRFGDTSHHLVGTLKPGCGGTAPPCVQKVVSRAAPRKLLKAALGSDVIIYDLHDADLEELEFVLKSLKVSELGHDITFILISSVQVWGRTKRQYEPRPTPPVEVAPAEEAEVAEAAPPAEEAPAEEAADGEEVAAEEVEQPEVKIEMQPEMLSEDDYCRRVPAPKYQEWKTVETLVLALKEKEGITPYVVAAGIPYGNGEECFYDIFKSAWLGRQVCRLVAPGNNFIPCVHARDLARLVRTTVIEKPEKSYLLAVDKGNLTQKEIISTVVSEMSELTGDIPVIPHEQALLAEFTDVMTLDLRLQPSELMTSESFRWWSGDGFVANFQKVAEEFNKWRKLKPIQILLLGPPGSGAEELAPLVAENYRLQPIRFDQLMDEVIKGEDEKGAELRQKLVEIHEIANDPKKAAAGVPSVPVELLIGIMEEGLKNKVCQFRGWAGTGFPLSIEEAEALFLEDAPVEAPPEGEEEAEAEAPAEGAEEPPPLEKVPRKQYLPQHVFFLTDDEASCLARAKEEPEFSEGNFKHKTDKYKKDTLGEDGQNLLADWFQEKLGITATVIDVAQVISDGGSLEGIATQIFEQVDSSDPPFNFLPVIREKPAEVVEEEAGDTDAAAREEELKAQEREQKRKEAEEQERLEAVKKTEQQLLEKYSESLRQYLTTFVVPTLTKGLIEVCQEQPADPVDYLAEYLFAFHSQSVPAASAVEEPTSAV